MFFIILVIALSLFIWIRYEGAKTNRQIQKKKNAFWNKENQANITRKADISKLDYITIPLNKLPFVETSDEILKSLQDTITNLSSTQILNLTGYSNTDLKLEYGVANFSLLSEYDNNYTILIHHLYNWGSYLYDHNQLQEAITVLEYGVQCKTDISKHYILLANIYIATNVSDKINDLIVTVSSLNTMMKDSILTSLKKMKLSSYLV